jgi:Na+/H+ antiporter NhaA
MEPDLFYTLKQFLLWCLILNTGIYAFTAFAVFAFRKPVCWIHEKIFNFDEATTLKSIHRYLAHYKLLITAFNFVPWVALLIIG